MRTDLDPASVPLSHRVLREVLDQATRLATGAIMMSAIITSANYDRGVAMARAFAIYLARVALVPFLVAFCAEAWTTLRPSAHASIVLSQRASLDRATATIFIVHLLAVAGYVLASDDYPGPVVLVGGTLGYVAILVRPAFGDSHVRSRQKLYTASGFYLWFLFFATYAQRVLGDPAKVSPVMAGVFVATLIGALVITLLGLRKKLGQETVQH